MAAIQVVPNYRAVRHVRGRGQETVNAIPGAVLTDETDGVVSFTFGRHAYWLQDGRWFVWAGEQVHGVLGEKAFRDRFAELT